MIPVIGRDNFVARWVCSKLGTEWVQGSGYAFGYALPDKGLVAGVVFTQYNGVNIFIDLVIEDVRATRGILRFIGEYCFGQLGCRRLTLCTSSDNLAAQSLHARLGAVREAVLEGAAPGGNDILISRLTPDCKIWQRWRKDGQQRKSPESSELQRASPPADEGGDRHSGLDDRELPGQRGHAVGGTDLDLDPGRDEDPGQSTSRSPTDAAGVTSSPA